MFIVPVCFYLAWLVCYALFTMILCGDYVRRNGMATMIDNFETKFWHNLLDKHWRKTKIIRLLRLDSDEKRHIAWPLMFSFGHIVYNVGAMFLAWVNFHCFYLMLVFNSFWIMRAFYNGANYYMTRFSAHYEQQLAKLEELEQLLSAKD